MVFRCLRWCLICLFPAAGLWAGPLDLKVIYPAEGQNLPSVESTFVFGSVRPGSSLTINGAAIPIHKEGGWLAFLPVRPGRFTFKLGADRKGIHDSLAVTVNLPPMTDLLDSLFIIPESPLPIDSVWVHAGDIIDLAVTATPFCRAFCVIEPMADTVPILEIPPQPFYGGRSVFRKQEPPRMIPGDTIRGRYRGTYRLPSAASQSVSLSYYIVLPSDSVIDRLLIENAASESSAVRLRRLSQAGSSVKVIGPFPIRILDSTIPNMVEFKDSLTNVRTGPQKSFFSLHQPAGIRAEMWGRWGRWLKLQLSDNHFGWVSDTAVMFMPPGTALPHSYVKFIQTIADTGKTTVTVSVGAKLPFRIDEDPAAKSLTLYLYGADSETDWIRYDTRDSLIDQIVWSQPESGLYSLKIFLTGWPVWGYDAYYVGTSLHLDLIRPPHRHAGLSGLRIVVDPGHSPDVGAVGPTGLTEKEANLSIARQLKKMLEWDGAKVILTRSDNSVLPLYDRPKIAIAERADLFISIHNNALPDGVNPFVSNGVSTYYYHPHAEPLARELQRSLAGSLGLGDFGLYYANLAVDRPTQYPAILVECSFMMIPEQEAQLKTERFQKRVARAIVDGLKAYLSKIR